MGKRLASCTKIQKYSFDGPIQFLGLDLTLHTQTNDRYTNVVSTAGHIFSIPEKNVSKYDAVSLCLNFRF